MNNGPNYRVCKNQLKNVLKTHFYGNFFSDNHQNLSKNDVLEIIEDAVIRTNIIVFHTYNFLKLYLLYLYENHIDLPLIDKDFIKMIMFVVAIKGDPRGRPNTKNVPTIKRLLTFYLKHYRSLIKIEDLTNNYKLSYILDKEAEDMVKNINNNIKEHFIDHVRKYINDFVNLKDLVRGIEADKKLSYWDRKNKIREIRKEWNELKYDVLSTKQFINMDPDKILLIRLIKQDLLPYQNFLKDSIYYDLEVNPQNYLKSMININNKISNLSINRNKIYKLFHILPLRTSIEPKYITLNTNAISSLFSGQAKYQNNTSEKEIEIWGSLFNMDVRCFKWKGYEFANTIKTDGISCSIVFQELTINQKKKVKINSIQNQDSGIFTWNNDTNNDNGKIKKNRKYLTKKERENIHYSVKDNNTDHYEYIEEVKLDHLRNRKIVCIDPGHHTLADCMAEKCEHKVASGFKYHKNKIVANLKEPMDTFFKYSRAQRNRESKKFRYEKILKRIKNEEIIALETILSNHNSKTCRLKEFRKYLVEKIKLNRKLYEHYRQPIYRKLKFNRYINYRKSEEKFIKNFQKKYGNPNKVVVIFGDYSKRETMKGSEPHLVKRLKRLFRLHGYLVYLIDEYNTSKLCNRCGSCLEQCKKVTNKHGNESLLWRLLRCTSSKCLTYHNRDRNATRNMMKIVKSLMAGKGRPSEYNKKTDNVFPKRTPCLYSIAKQCYRAG